MKALLFNRSALAAKYGQGTRDVEAALDEIIATDANRGLATRAIAVDDVSTMSAFGAHAVPSGLPSESDERTYKDAVDAIYGRLAPDYIALIGSNDLFPHQQLVNPLLSSSADGDPSIPSDLPYACEDPHGTDAAAFRGPTRVVGRVPDLGGATAPDHLLTLLSTAASWTPGTAADFQSILGISAAEWQMSTTASLRTIVGNDEGLRLCPPRDFDWPAHDLSRRSHFINCHGESTIPKYFGDKIVAHESDVVHRLVMPGTIVAAECCYGAELHDALRQKFPFEIAQAYLSRGAYAFFGSTNRSFGPLDDSTICDHADLMCQYFFRHVLAGRSTGMAALLARQDFVQTKGSLNPTAVKTLAQFTLLGDPSIHPVEGGSKGFDRPITRLFAFYRGLDLRWTTAAAGGRRENVDSAVEDRLRSIADDLGLIAPAYHSFGVNPAAPERVGKAMPPAFADALDVPLGFHVVIGRRASTSGVERVIVATLVETTSGFTRLDLAGSK